MRKVIYKDVKKEAFDRLSELCKYKKGEDNSYAKSVTVEYSGNNLRGDLIICVSPGNTKIYKAFIRQAGDIVADSE